MFAALFLLASIATIQHDSVLNFYRGTWQCEGRNYKHQSYSLTYRYTVDPDAPSSLRLQTVYFIGKRKGTLSGQLSPSGNGFYIATGANKTGFWITAGRGWTGDTLTFTDILLPGERERDRLTVTRSSRNAFSQLDQRLGPDGKPGRTNTTATCRRLSN
ncbi:MAG: hypothetical protein NVSMB31_11070 [Vulcanimicrobiaceae bacterium]